ncbi:MAG: phosphopentomutase [bacterium]|nr:phosphopentomutase [bacterium]
MVRRVVVIVLDSLGAGHAPDAAAYGDEGANTLVNMSRVVPGGLRVPHLQALGLGGVTAEEIVGCPRVERPLGSYGRLIERSAGKDTMTGHWEMVGIVTREPFPTFPGGFPQEMMEEWATFVGVEGWLHNGVASGTEIIARLGEAHVRTGLPIVYTSADSVFQIAAHEKYFGLERLYAICERTREFLNPHRVARVIARPFVGEDRTTFRRTGNRRDYSLSPPEPHALTQIRDGGYGVTGIGKIYDIFAGSGITRALRTHSNREGMEILGEELRTGRPGMYFVNLVDFDMLYGHRRDALGYARALSEFDEQLGEVLGVLDEGDVLIITADHGLDPTWHGTDHTRETVPFLVYHPGSEGIELGVREGFCDVGATACYALGVQVINGRPVIVG